MMRKLLLAILLLFCSIANAAGGFAVAGAVIAMNHSRLSAILSGNNGCSASDLPIGHHFLDCTKSRSMALGCRSNIFSNDDMTIYKWAGMHGYKYVYHVVGIRDDIGVIRLEVSY